MLPLSYLAIPPHLTLPDEITDQILTALTFLSRSRLANTISLCTSLLRTSVSNLAQVLLSPDQRLALYLILGAAYEDPGLVHHYRRKATWVYEEVVLALDATFHAAVPSNRRSVLVDHGPDTRYQGGDWGVDWGADGTDDDDARDLRDWVNDIGNLLNVLATYQTEVERHFALVLHAPVEAATGDRLRARQDCRARVVRGVGAWFGRIEAREKRVGFVLQEQLAWREEEIVDAYANDDLEHEALLDLPPNILASIDYQPQPSTETVWPTVLIGEEGNGEGYSLRTRGVQPDNKAIMDIEWPVATRDHAVKPCESHAQDDTRDNARVQGLGTSEDHQRPLILYNDPDIFHRARPSTAGKHLNKAESHRRDQPVWPNEWPLMGGQYQSPQSKYPVGETRGLSKWSLSEHNIPSDLLRHGEEHAVK
ncbi:MAG TPA: hypothetical protein VHV10_04055, partial [Ktedonobacteraceae bacterium]|nr:hypothetical protein [Ktedonobacteraceae bacterium]